MFRFTVRQIEIFLEGSRLGSFRRAAEHLGISQAAISEQMRLLEAQLGATLFLRRPGRTIALTAEGEAFREGALAYVRSGRELGQMFRQRVPQQVRAFVGTFLLNEYVRPGLPYFLTNNPDIIMDFNQSLTGSAIDEAIERGTIDCALLSRPKGHPRGNFRSLTTEPAYIFANRALRDVAERDGLSSIPFIIWSIPPLHRASQLQLLASAGVIHPKIHSEVQHHDVATELAANGTGAVIMLQSTSRILDPAHRLIPILQLGMWERRLYIAESLDHDVQTRLYDFFNDVAGDSASTSHERP